MPTAASLALYKAKRNFSLTPEPADGGKPSAQALSFVIQKHWASHLHYDFRVEFDGTMKSWAVPKGPSLDPKLKRMAVQVEDHPISYSSFEGTIPPNQYGAGKVIIWDKGTWHPEGDPQKNYRSGNLKFELRGHKLRGNWVLVRMKGKEEKQQPWLLIKEKDEFARSFAEFSVTDALPGSVANSKCMAEPAQPTSEPVISNRSKKKSRHVLDLPLEAVKAELPITLVPQLASLVYERPVDPENWGCEIKFDGYRMLVRISRKDIRLVTRNGNDWTRKLAPLHDSLVKLKLPDGWYDGEVVVLNELGVPDFGALQQSFDNAKTDDIILYLFDLPYVDGHDLRAAPLTARRSVLQSLLSKLRSDRVRFSEAFDAEVDSVLASACKLGLEGVIAKRSDSVYESRRSSNWIKLKCGQRQEFVVGGYTAPNGSRTGFGSLLLGVYDAQGQLSYAGKVGTGFNQDALVNIKRRLDDLAIRRSPFPKTAGIVGQPNWVQPKLVAEVSFGEWTRGGHIRHAVFQGLRSDKDAHSIVRETSATTSGSDEPLKSTKQPRRALTTRLRVTNPERVIDPSTGTTKVELVQYYELVGDLMMRHLKSRPVSLVRAPSGVDGELFFQRHTEIDKLPGVQQLDPAIDTSHPALLEVATKQGLLSAAQWNVVEFHTRNSNAASFKHPDRMVFDLDPGEGVKWSQVQEAAELVHAFLTQLDLSSFLKTSGGKGLHVVVPLRRVHDWDTVKGFSHAIVSHLAKNIPQRFVARSGSKNRVGKIFIDYLRNSMAATTVCAWSARARPGLGISVPVKWSELNSLRGGNHWTVQTVQTRLNVGNGAWDGYARASSSLFAAMKLLDYQ